jgi:DNA polymerase elongation subunit (family B)
MSIKFQILDLYGKDDYDSKDYNIYIFGKTLTNKSICLEVNGFTPYFYVKMPEGFSSDNKPKFEKWVREHKYLNYYAKKKVKAFTLVYRKQFRGFTNNKQYPFIRIDCSSISAMRGVISLFVTSKIQCMNCKGLWNCDKDGDLGQWVDNGRGGRKWERDYRCPNCYTDKYFDNRDKYPKKVFIEGITDEEQYLEIFENMVDPVLRFIHKRKIDPCGWVQLKEGTYETNYETTTTSDTTISCNWKSVKKYQCKQMANFTIAAFDIECDSSHGDFPQAFKTYKKLARELVQVPKVDQTSDFYTTLISSAFEDGNNLYNISSVYTSGSKKPRNFERLGENVFKVIMDDSINDNYKVSKIDRLIAGAMPPNTKVLGDPVIQISTCFIHYGAKTSYKKNIIVLDTCDTFADDVDLVVCKTEQELLEKWEELIIAENPDIITGYNILGFDFPYVFHRAIELGIKINLSRFTDYECVIKKKKTKTKIGLVDMDDIELPGRVRMDIMKLVETGYNLSSYKLDNVSSHFIQSPILDIERKENVSVIHTKNIRGLNKGNFINILELQGYFEEKIGEGQKFKIYSIDSENKTLTVDPIPELDTQSKKYNWCLGKDDVSAQDIFRMQHEGPAERAIVAKYCVMDVILCIELLLKLELVTNNFGMANVCSTPFSWIIGRGQGIKITSLVGKRCRKEGYLLPYIFKSQLDKSSFEGAIVLKPYPGIYLDEPVVVLDYASLYPSSIISENLSHETICLADEWLGDEGGERIRDLGFDYSDITYDVFKYIYTSSGNIKGKEKTGVKTVRYVQYAEEQKGIVPNILDDLLTARRVTREKAKFKTLTLKNGNPLSGILKDKDDVYELMQKTWSEPKTVNKDDVVDIKDTYSAFEKAIIDGLQQAYKVTANSLYGQLGAKTSTIYLKELAASTTAVGRQQLEIAQKYVEEPSNFPVNQADGTTVYRKNKVVYGDSVTGDTPLILRDPDGRITIKTIEDVSNEWKPYEEFKPFDTNRREKQQAKTEYQIWTNGTWADIHRVIRHKTKKRIFRVNTHCGVIDVTEDHSLMDSDLNKIKPKDCIVGETELAHSFPSFDYTKIPLQINEIMNILDNYNYTRTKEEQKAFIEGMFYGDGSCGYYQCKSGNKYSWAINNQNMNLLEQCQKYLENIYDTSFKILDTLKSSGVYKLVVKGSTKYMVNLFRPEFYDKNKYKTIPSYIFNSDYNIRLQFFLGYYAADGYKKNNIRFSNKGKIGSAQLYYLANSLGYNTSICIRHDKPNIYRINCSYKKGKSSYRKNPYIIKKMVDLGEYDGTVYDIETGEGCFNGGVGEMVVKNTDSIFVTYDTLGKTGKDGLKESIDLGVQSEHGIQKLLKDPQVLEYEKTFWPFILFSKKRYIGDKYEFDINKCKRTNMGVVLKRRDNAPILKIIFGGVVDIIMSKGGVQPSIEFLKKAMEDLIAGKYPLETLIITKTLSSYYKKPKQIAHKVLADRMGERDPGNKPKANDRIPYVFAMTPKVKEAQGNKKKEKALLQGDMIEHIDYVRKHNTPIHYEQYLIRQIIKPVSQIYGLILEDLEEYRGPGKQYYINMHKKLLKSGKTEIAAINKIRELKQKDAGKIIFGDILRRLNNKKMGMSKDITHFFPVKKKKKGASSLLLNCLS